MKLRDIITMSVANLTRRKARTMLTVLGVAIGCCSVVLLVSIGVGTKEAQDVMLEGMGDLRLITVYGEEYGAPKDVKLDEPTILTIHSLPHVAAASPKLQASGMSIMAYAGKNRRYVHYSCDLIGLEPEALEQLGYGLVEGEWLSGASEGQMLVGEQFAYYFEDSKKPSGRNRVNMWAEDGEEIPDPFFDPLEQTYEFELSAYDDEKNEKAVVFKPTVVGRLQEDMSKGWETQDSVLLPLKELETILAEYEKKNRSKPGQNRREQRGYSQALVIVDDIRHVEDVEAGIQAMGFQTNSLESIRRPLEKEARQKQMTLAGQGAVSLLVAALGITNTMIMSISERTREIGVMKTMGCLLGNIRTMFLLEAGLIGLIGGAAGIFISLLVSAGINLMSAELPITSMEAAMQVLENVGGRVSVIPLWLIWFAIIFSVIVGVLAGFYPARKAMRISALEAIKHE